MVIRKPHAQIMQLAYTHKAVTGHVEAIRLLCLVKGSVTIVTISYWFKPRLIHLFQIMPYSRLKIEVTLICGLLQQSKREPAEQALDIIF